MKSHNKKKIYIYLNFFPLYLQLLLLCVYFIFVVYVLKRELPRCLCLEYQIGKHQFYSADMVIFVFCVILHNAVACYCRYSFVFNYFLVSTFLSFYNLLKFMYDKFQEVLRSCSLLMRAVNKAVSAYWLTKILWKYK